MIDERTPEELEAAREALGMNAEELEQARNYVAGDSKWIAAGGGPSVTAHSPGPGERRDPHPHLALRGRCPGHNDAAGYQLVDGLHRGLSRVRAIILAWGPFEVDQHVRDCLAAWRRSQLHHRPPQVLARIRMMGSFAASACRAHVEEQVDEPVTDEPVTSAHLHQRPPSPPPFPGFRAPATPPRCAGMC